MVTGGQSLSIEFLSPRDVVFSCSECGDCCRSLNVPVAPAEREALERLSWEGREERLVGKPATVPTMGPAGPGRRLPREDDGSCTYLAEDGRCLIHRHFGAATKPAACRLYPFSFHRLGDVVAVDCAFSCRAVSRGQGRRLEDHEAEWTELVEGGAVSEQLPYRLSPKATLTGELAQAYQSFLESFLADRSLELPQRLRRCLQFNVLATTGSPDGPMAAMLRDGIATGLRHGTVEDWRGEEMDKTQEAIFHQWLYLALNPPPANMDTLAKADLDTLARQRVRAGLAFREKASSPWVDNKQLPVTFEQVLTISSSFADSAQAAELFERFLLAKITGQRFLLAGGASLPFTEAVPKFLLCYPMVIWTAKALAAARGERALAMVDLQESIRLVDRSLGQIATSPLPKKRAQVCDFVMLETDFVLAATTTVRRV